MKNITEKIINILEDNFDEPNKIDDQTTIYMQEKFIKIADKILALPLYPKEFVEWIAKKELTYLRGRYYQDSDGGYREFTLDELYEYWKNLPK
jgi:hypothetical protein